MLTAHEVGGQLRSESTTNMLRMSPRHKESSRKRVPPYDIERERRFVEYILCERHFVSVTLSA